MLWCTYGTLFKIFLMNLLIAALLGLILAQQIVAPPVNRQEPEEQKPETKAEQAETESIETKLEYGRYLREVVNLLEEDDGFRTKISNMTAEQIWDGSISEFVDLLNHNIRTRLDELKRREVSRLRDVARKEAKLAEMNKQNLTDRLKVDFADHLDSNTLDEFSPSDLKRLIKKVRLDMEALDKQRAEEFKRYEIEKEAKFREGIKDLPLEEQTKQKAEHFQEKKQETQHEPVHHPGSKDQLEEVWEKNDDQDPESFNPKTFFKLHDINDDGFLDPAEIEALFTNELDKVYGPNATDHDMVERYEEMNRMREHFVKQLDKDGDYLISLKEFMDSTADPDFEQDEGWKTIDEEAPVYTEDELAEFERQLSAHDRLPPSTTQPLGMPPGGHPAFQPQQGMHPGAQPGMQPQHL